VTLFASQPIGIFDSGVGGLTVARALTQLLPQEKIIYFGDVAHHPYGEKSPAAIQAYTIKICDMLLQQNVKIILIACNSASAAAHDLAREYVGSKAKVINVIDPTIDYLRENLAHKKIGMIATRATVNSQLYHKKIEALGLGISLTSLPAPLLVALIEEGFADHNILTQTLASYLSHPLLENIDALLLACTHYPVIKNQIRKFYNNNMILIDNSEITAQAVKGLLTHHHLLNQQTTMPLHQFYVSDYTDSFIAGARIFFPDALHFEHYPLWE
jgi:glutamate racemase